ncbi:sugar phosphate isomerase [Solibacillus sp. A46]|uniref:Sugar phosphate isomerase n=1 Tax=Solibacillus faecavium TaxID=2762221 RepID=A0ABR8XVQ9_9BACL|nr:sugar phosphate isomerase [Solibacillus faecavium]MBD8036030.1 sugar phosphate isomerase [Solibacillus faecavium]
MNTQKTHYVFYYPFNYRQYHFEKFEQLLKQHHFYHFKMDYENDLYGTDVEISHQLLKQFYYPFVEEKLLNDDVSHLHFNRYSKKIQEQGVMVTQFDEIPFTLLSTDINLCPFGIGIAALRIELEEEIDINAAISFGHYFRVLQPKIDEEMGATIHYEDFTFENTEELIFKKIAPFLEKFFVDYSAIHKNISKIPFFEDERMYVSAFFQFDEDTKIDEFLLYRAGQLNGRDSNGDPYISSTNEEYIKRFIDEHTYQRWAPRFYTITTLQGHIQLTNVDNESMKKYLGSFHSISYYTLLIHYFYKLMLLKLIFEHSELKFSKDKDIVEELIEQITKFASRYYFTEVSVRTEGKEISNYFRKVFRIDGLYHETKETLEELYRIQEDRSADRLNKLIFILTIFSMISGIYGMNLVIEMLGEPIQLSDIVGFTLFEWIALILAMLGLFTMAALIINQLFNFTTSIYGKLQRKRQR